MITTPFSCHACVAKWQQFRRIWHSDVRAHFVSKMTTVTKNRYVACSKHRSRATFVFHSDDSYANLTTRNAQNAVLVQLLFSNWRQLRRFGTSHAQNTVLVQLVFRNDNSHAHLATRTLKTPFSCNFSFPHGDSYEDSARRMLKTPLSCHF